MRMHGSTQHRLRGNATMTSLPALPAHAAHSIGIGTRIKGLVQGVGPVSRHVEQAEAATRSLASHLDEMARLEAANPLPSFYIPVRDQPKHADFIAAARRADGAQRAIARAAEKADESIRLRHPELVEARTWQEESWGSLLGGLLSSSYRTGKLVTRTSTHVPAAIDELRNAAYAASVRAHGGPDFAFTFNRVGAGELDRIRDAIRGVRQLARHIGD
jgi:hypothetical protein